MFSLVTRRARLGCTRIGSPGILGVPPANALCVTCGDAYPGRALWARLSGENFARKEPVMPTIITHPDSIDAAAVRARVAQSASLSPCALPPGQVARAQDLAADLLATFARHGIPAYVVENVTSVCAAAVDSVRWVSAIE